MLFQNSGALFMSTTGAQVKPDGSFAIANVAPGDYALRMMGGPGLLGGGGSTPEVIAANVTVAGEDIAGFRLAGTKPLAVTGRIILPPTGIGAVRPSTLQLMTASTQLTLLGMLDGSLNAGRVGDDFTFALKVQPGHHVIRLGPQSQGVAIKAVRLQGEDVTDSGIEFRPNEDVSGVKVELTFQQSELSGTVTDARSRPVKDYSVVVFARNPRLWTNASRYFGGGRPDQDGRFKVRNLPAAIELAALLTFFASTAATAQNRRTEHSQSQPIRRS